MPTSVRSPLGPRIPGWKRAERLLTEIAEQGERVNARRLFALAVYRGDLVRPKKCELCGKRPKQWFGHGVLEAHHTDYRKPYQVSWLCNWCHNWADHKTKMVYLAAYGLPGKGVQDWRYR